MIETIAKKITSFFINKRIIESKNKEIYDYSFEIAIVCAISNLVLIAIAILFNEVVCSFIFGLSFSLFRRISGGYHASSYVKCSVMSLASFLILILMVKKAFFFEYNYFNLMIYLGIILLLSPIEDANKPITEKQYKLFKKISRTLAVVLAILFSIIKLFSLNDIFDNKYFFSFNYSIGLVAFSLIISKLERRIKSAKS